MTVGLSKDPLEPANSGSAKGQKHKSAAQDTEMGAPMTTAPPSKQLAAVGHAKVGSDEHYGAVLVRHA
jgi:hypothetical protein